MIKLYTTVGIIETGDYDDIFDYVLHREDGPAFISYYCDGSIFSEEWFINGVYHREDGPAKICYNMDRSIAREVWFMNGLCHREDGPAYAVYDDGKSREAWYWCGMLHRHDYIQPSVKYSYDEYEYYWYGVECKAEQLLDKSFRDRIALEVLG